MPPCTWRAESVLFADARDFCAFGCNARQHVIEDAVDLDDSLQCGPVDLFNRWRYDPKVGSFAL